MSQNDLVIDNQSFPATRADINSALQALGSLNSGSSAPSTTYANMLWYDTSNNTLKMRSEANDQWISIGYLDQSAGAFRIFDDTQVVNSSGTQTGLIGDQATSAWEAGTSTTESLVSPAKVKAAVDELVDFTAFAEGAAGQPRIETSAFASSYYTAGGIGTYCFARSTAGSSIAFGNTVAGSWLRPISAPYGGSGVFGSAPPFPDGAAQTGTWRAMGQYTSSVSDGESNTMGGATLWLRIS